MRVNLTTPVLILATLALAATALWHMPRPATLSEHTAGDPALASQLRHLLPERGHQSVAAAVITPDTVTHAAVGEAAPGSGQPLQPDSTIELGSITKTFTGVLLAQAVERGEVALDDPVERHVPELAGSPVGPVSLADLAAHRAGVPSLPPSVALGGLGTLLNADNPYEGTTRASLTAELTTLPLADTAGTVSYSNLGVALLGWALADAAGAPDWATLTHERLLDPAGVQATFAGAASDIPDASVQGWTTNGLSAEHWTSPGFVPSGVATYTTPTSVAAWAQAMLAADAAATEAMTPRFEDDGGHVGMGWFIAEVDGRQVTWHNGGTGGYSTMLTLDRDAQRATFVVGNTSARVDAIGLALLLDEDEAPQASQPWWQLALVPGVTTLLVVGAVTSALRGQHRAAIINGLAGAAFGLVLSRSLGDWAALGGWIWPALVVVTAGAGLVAAFRWPTLPNQPTRRGALAWIGAGASVLLVVASVVLSL